MASTRFTRTRARLGVLSRSLPPDHSQLAALREELASALVVQRIAAVLDKSSAPLTPELRAEIEALLAERELAGA